MFLFKEILKIHTSMSITGEINELKSINQEIARLSNNLKELRKKKRT